MTKMAKRDKMQKAIMGMLAAMMVASLVFAVLAFVAPTPVAAIPCPGTVKYPHCGDCWCDGQWCYIPAWYCYRYVTYDDFCNVVNTDYECEPQ